MFFQRGRVENDVGTIAGLRDNGRADALTDVYEQ
jgi:hypothetical protein